MKKVLTKVIFIGLTSWYIHLSPSLGALYLLCLITDVCLNLLETTRLMLTNSNIVESTIDYSQVLSTIFK